MSLKATVDRAFRKRVGRRLREARLDMLMTMKVSASKLGVSAACVSMAECGTYGPGLELLVRMARLYGVSTDYILCLID